MQDSPNVAPHIPVLLGEVLDGLQVRPGGSYIDGTVGAGGHSAAILERAGEDGKLLGLDVDPVALNLAEEKLGTCIERGQARLVQSNFERLAEVAQAEGFAQADGVLLD